MSVEIRKHIRDPFYAKYHKENENLVACFHLQTFSSYFDYLYDPKCEIYVTKTLDRITEEDAEYVDSLCDILDNSFDHYKTTFKCSHKFVSCEIEPPSFYHKLPFATRSSNSIVIYSYSESASHAIDEGYQYLKRLWPYGFYHVSCR